MCIIDQSYLEDFSTGVHLRHAFQENSAGSISASVARESFSHPVEVIVTFPAQAAPAPVK